MPRLLLYNEGPVQKVQSMYGFQKQRNLGAIGLPTQRNTDPCRVKLVSQGIGTAERKRIE